METMLRLKEKFGKYIPTAYTYTFPCTGKIGFEVQKVAERFEAKTSQDKPKKKGM